MCEQHRAIVFFDGQNIYQAAREAFGLPRFNTPNYDPLLLARFVCERRGLALQQTRFYTGVPPADKDRRWNGFWNNKLRAMASNGVHVFQRPVRYRMEKISVGDGVELEREVGKEKGVDVRIAIDMLTLFMRKAYDVAVVFSQDQDLSEAVTEMKEIAEVEGRHFFAISAFPFGQLSQNNRPITGTSPERIALQDYDKCLDKKDYRARP